VNRILSIIALFVMSCCTISALDKNDIMTLTKVGIEKEAILVTIEKSDSKFDLTAADVIELKNAGVDDAVVKAMLSARCKKEIVVAAPAPKVVVVEQPVPVVVKQQPQVIVEEQPVIVRQPTTIVYETVPVYVAPVRYYTPAPKPSYFNFDFIFGRSGGHRPEPRHDDHRSDRHH
jgi:hypothetical protein